MGVHDEPFLDFLWSDFADRPPPSPIFTSIRVFQISLAFLRQGLRC
jgi:hypothetical protein